MTQPRRLITLWKPVALLAFAACSALPAFSQVVRCTDPKTGQVTYTDRKCAAGTTGHEVEAKRSAEEIEQDRKAAERAIELKQQRLQAEKAAADLQAQREADQERVRAARAAATAPQPQDYARSAECARSRRNLELVSSTLSGNTYDQEPRLEAAQRQMDLDCLGPQGYAEVEKARAAQPRVVVVPPAVQPAPVFPPPFPTTPGVGQPAQRYLTQCGDFSCTDNFGQKYPRVGPGRFQGPGGVCRSAGGQAPC